MRKAYRHAVTDTPEALAYQHWLGQQIVPLGGTLIDLSDPSWIDESLFVDALHLNHDGAQRLSRDLGDQLASLLVSVDLEKIRSAK